MLNVKNLTAGYEAKTILNDVSFDVKKGEFFGIAGPNGCGKTTLLKSLTHLIKREHGEIILDGKPIEKYSAKDFAKKAAVLPQMSPQTFSYSVKETVALGRYAHKRGLFHTWTEHDEQIVLSVMEQTGVRHLESAQISECSGGEQQRIFLAQALAQEPEILLLDEPTNHLDLSFQKELMDLLKEWTLKRKLTVISIFHDLNLASLYCDRILLMENGQVMAVDTPKQVLKEELIEEVYNTSIQKQAHPSVAKPQMLLVPEYPEKNAPTEIDDSFLTIDEAHLVIQSPTPLKTLSSGVTGAGLGWHKTFMIRRVPPDYSHRNYQEEMKNYLIEHGFDPMETVGFMTAVNLGDASYQLYRAGTFSVFILVTAGTGNAIDTSKHEDFRDEYNSPGTINTWIFVNGKLSEEAFIQGIVTATEAKVKVMQDEEVIDRTTGTTATGTSTDSISIAATQAGEEHPFAGTMTALGQMISKGVYECTQKAVRNYRRRL
ncbi:adenosylcobinamide amidohydrolase [Falsibacillus pallidus]|uniref:adenosylcobinamide amidohydrolase n=1 Tax=Falsibacillus pallidus TaxID=493781 RepID=UPI003D95D6C3